MNISSKVLFARCWNFFWEFDLYQATMIKWTRSNDEIRGFCDRRSTRIWIPPIKIHHFEHQIKILKWILTFGQLMNEHPLWWNRKWNLLHPRATLTYVSYHLLQMKWFLSEQVILFRMNHDTVWLKNGEIVKKFLTLAALWTWNSWLWWIKNPQPCATYNQFEYLIKEFCSDSDFRFLDRKQPLHVRKFNFDDVKGSFEVIWKADLLITAEIQGVKCKFLFSQFLVDWILPYDESK